MNKKFWIISIIAILLIGGSIFFWIKNKNSKNNSSYEASKSSTNVSNTNSKSNNTEKTNTIQNININVNSSTDNKENTNNSEKAQATAPKETQISTFSTKIVTKDTNRQNNIQITCSTLNNSIVKTGDIFSFCNTVGPATSSKGYKEADIFDNTGKKKKGLGGGNCQVSTTLYNAVLAVPDLIVIERHEHSNYVPYIQEGKDAAVAYGSYDLKFRNNTKNDIKIKAEATRRSNNHYFI